MWGSKKKAPVPSKSAPSEDADEFMDFNQFSSDQHIDIQSILNDQSLNQELLDLGWEVEHPASNPMQNVRSKALLAPTPNSSQAPQPSHTSSTLPSEIPDLTSIGDVDESAIALSAEDLQDPELLGMYEALGSGVGG
ncbi:hypothetical protein EON65_58185, partial [archaeon]